LSASRAALRGCADSMRASHASHLGSSGYNDQGFESRKLNCFYVFTILEESGGSLFSLFRLFSVRTVQNSDVLVFRSQSANRWAEADWVTKSLVRHKLYRVLLTKQWASKWRKSTKQRKQWAFKCFQMLPKGENGAK